MKTHEFARHLEQLARLLRQLPNVELESKHAPDLQGLLPGIAPAKRDSAREPRTLPKNIEDRLASMSPSEIEAFLLSDDEAFTIANLTDLAKRMGLTSSKRQSKSALVNMIARHYEASRMHSIMRGVRQNDT